jgi:hypothetical protein
MKGLFLFTTAREIGPETSIVRKTPLDCTAPLLLHAFTTFVHSACTGTHWYHFSRGRSENALALKVGRAQNLFMVHDNLLKGAGSSV